MTSLMRVVALSVGLALTTVASGATPVADADTGYVDRPHLQILPDGRRFNLACVGTCPRTIVFLQGAGSRIEDWGKVMPGVRRLGRLCFYDRPGYGFSDAPVAPMTLNSTTSDLRALLHAGGIAPPYILVGHSLGGYYAAQYANRFGSEVAGLVLVEPAFSGVYEVAWSSADKRAFATLVSATFQDQFRCRGLALENKISLVAPQGCQVQRPDVSPEKIVAAERYLLPAFYDAALLEIEATVPIGTAAPADVVEERAAARKWGRVPVIVLTAGKHAPLPGLSEAGNAAYQAHWRDGHRALAARSTRGESLEVASASHFIQLDSPQSVVDAISQVALAR